MADKASVSFPEWMLREIDDRRGNVPRSTWLQEAVAARINDEDTGQWDSPELTEPERNEPPVEAD